ncbi:MAG TPA: hypothetical protein VF796_05195, partial [Humisphaera sp.]
MLYHLPCPGCGLPVPYDRARAGRTVTCVGCGRTVLTPPVLKAAAAVTGGAPGLAGDGAAHAGRPT